MTATDPREDLYIGRYAELVAALIDGPAVVLARAVDVVAAVGALAFLGRIDEADALLTSRREALSSVESVEARFYVAVAMRRHHRLAEARKLLAANLRAVRRGSPVLAAEDGDRAVFFAYQGVGFFRYAEGRMALALTRAERAYGAAFRAGFVFGRVFALDLKGHAQVNVGHVQAGFSSLKAAARLATTLGRGAVSQRAEGATLLYRSTLGYGGAAILTELDDEIKRCDFEDSYTLAGLYLERARFATLCGRLSQARRSIEDASQWVYGLDHPILDAGLSLRMAQIAAFRNDTAQALSLIRAATKRLETTVDLATEAQALGMEHAILRKAGRLAEADRLAARLTRVARRSGSALVSRQNSRSLGNDPVCAVRPGEDPLGDLLDDIARRGAAAVPEILATGFIGLLPQALGLASDCRAVIFGLKGESVTVFDGGDIRHDAGGWPELTRRLLFHLARGESSKEDIARAVWDQRYNPLRHDPLIYALVARLRRLLEPQDGWLEVGENGYRLRAGVSVSVHWDRAEAAHAPSPSVMTAFDSHVSEALQEGLSLRQSGILQLCRRTGSLSNRAVCDAFGVSDVTASRDLAELVEQGRLQRAGRGRSTMYVLSQVPAYDQPPTHEVSDAH